MGSTSRAYPILTVIGVLHLSLTGSLIAHPSRTPLTVSAASNMTPVLMELEDSYEKRNRVDVIINFGSTKKLAQQITEGAPVDLFMSADVATVNDLKKQGLLLPHTICVYARGRLVIWTPADSSLRIRSLRDIDQPGVTRVAIADPDRAPYGAAARQAMVRIGVWERIKGKVVYGDNVAQTLQYAQTKNVDVAIIPVALAIDAKGKSVDVPQSLHDPVDQALGVVKGGVHKKEALSFVAYLLGVNGRRVLKKYGYSLPERSGQRH